MSNPNKINAADAITERVHFRLIMCPNCDTALCCVNPRLYNYCPECGVYLAAKIKSCIAISDPTAILQYHQKLP